MKKLAAYLLLAMTVAASAASAPRVALRDITRLPIVVAAPYDEKANASAAVDGAFARAKQSGKRVMIILGGNWCADCIVLANLNALPEVRPFLDAHFERVSVDVGRFDRNLQVPARFGIKRLLGVPTVLVATPDGKLLNDADPFTLANASAMSPQATVNWLAQWTN